MEVYAKGEVQRLRRWRATGGCSPFGVLNGPAGPFDPYMSQKHQMSERWTLGEKVHQVTVDHLWWTPKEKFYNS